MKTETAEAKTDIDRAIEISTNLSMHIRSLLGCCSNIENPSRDTINGYLMVFSDLPIDKVKAAIQELISTSEVHVPPARVRRMVLGGSDPGAGDEAWKFYVGRLRQVGVMATRALDHPDKRAQAALIAIGAASALNCSEQDLQRIRGQFLDAYNRPETKKRK